MAVITVEPYEDIEEQPVPLWMAATSFLGVLAVSLAIWWLLLLPAVRWIAEMAARWGR